MKRHHHKQKSSSSITITHVFSCSLNNSKYSAQVALILIATLLKSFICSVYTVSCVSALVRFESCAKYHLKAHRYSQSAPIGSYLLVQPAGTAAQRTAAVRVDPARFC